MLATVGLTHFLILAGLIFTIGVMGIFMNRRNVLVILMSIELMLMGVMISFTAFAHHLSDLTGQVFVMYILAIAAAEAAIGLAILVIYFRRRSTIDVDDMSELKG